MPAIRGALTWAATGWDCARSKERTWHLVNQQTDRRYLTAKPKASWTIEPDELNSFARVDLGIQRLLGEVRVFTAGENAEDFAANTLQGYAVEVSNDGFQWREVGAIRGIADFAQTAVAFEPIFGRFLRVVATELDPLRRARVADIQVTGQGVAPRVRSLRPR